MTLARRLRALFAAPMLVACSEAAVPIADARASDAGDPCDTTERCDVEGARMCADDRALECVRTTSCLEWRELERCGDGYTCEDGACRGDCYAPGTHRGRTLVSGGERRSYLLHVPASVSCDAPAPLWIDLHGTASDTPEEAGSGSAPCGRLSRNRGVHY